MRFLQKQDHRGASHKMLNDVKVTSFQVALLITSDTRSWNSNVSFVHD